MKDAAVVRKRTLPMWGSAFSTPRPPAQTAITIGLYSATVRLERTAPRL